MDKQKLRDRGAEKKVGHELTLQRKRTLPVGRLDSSSSIGVDDYSKGQKGDDDFFTEDDANQLMK